MDVLNIIMLSYMVYISGWYHLLDKGFGSSTHIGIGRGEIRVIQQKVTMFHPYKQTITIEGRQLGILIPNQSIMPQIVQTLHPVPLSGSH